ncbi:hypothetical protein V6N11_058444 [Hibiscus sabdariffa]|uniref:Uncharacterized protein n=1 Tax=Hibiscus sabdariffa TaxID=183260 RepID=A0ABR2U4C4_9ROSI
MAIAQQGGAATRMGGYKLPCRASFMWSLLGYSNRIRSLGLKHLERKEYVIIEYVPNERGTNPPRASKDKFEKHMDDMLDVGCLVLATITLELQKLHEYVVSYEMIQNLKEIFEGKA